MTEGRPAIVLDCDPGHDDALAIAVAGVHTDLLGITTVAGNVPLDLTTRNARAMVEVLGLDVPVHRGSRRPLVAEPRTAEFIHGASGLDGPTLPTPTRDLASEDAVGFLVDTVRARPGEVWIVATGPLTNVALALRTAPDVAEKVAGIALMGGGVPFGNVTPSAEFNVLVDPEAADIVFRSGARIVMAGLNVTHQWMIGAPVVERLRAARRSGGRRSAPTCSPSTARPTRARSRAWPRGPCTIRWPSWPSRTRTCSRRSGTTWSSSSRAPTRVA